MLIVVIIGVAYAATKAAEKVTEMYCENKENKAYGLRPVALYAPEWKAPSVETALTTTELRRITRSIDAHRTDRVAASARLWQ
jgi:predicted DNA repair protein MutK